MCTISQCLSWAVSVGGGSREGGPPLNSLRVHTTAAHTHPPHSTPTLLPSDEQYNPYFVEQVLAMEARSAAVGSPPLRYMFPSNSGLRSSDAARLLAAAPAVVPRVLPDLHVGAGGAVGAAQALFASPPTPGFEQGAINCETNAGTHDLQRALDEAGDLIDWFTADPAITGRLYARTASFCTGSSSQYDSWDQAMSFFLPNATWLQPPGHVHAMVTATWGASTLAATQAGGGGCWPCALCCPEER